MKAKAHPIKWVLMISMQILLSMIQEHLSLELDFLLDLKGLMFKGRQLLPSLKCMSFIKKPMGLLLEKQ